MKNYKDLSGEIHLGNCLDVLREFKDESVDCCITSPPYWGLRDYGTATWEGGSADCSHKRDSKASDSCTTGQRNLEGAIGDGIYKAVCARCGAKRIDEQIGLEETPEEYVNKLVDVFKEIKRILKKEGTLWLNLGDSYSGSGKGRNEDGTVHVNTLLAKQGTSAGTVMGNVPSGIIPIGLKPKDLVGIPWMVAFALRTDGWFLRQDIIWAKPNPMPESVTDRCTKAHEYIFLLSKSQHYYFDNEAIKEPAQNWGIRNRSNMRNGTEDPKLKHYGLTGNDDENQSRNKRSVWTVNTKSYSEAHFATYPTSLIEPMIKAGCPENGIVIDPFFGSGTTGRVAKDLKRKFIGIELNPDYIEISKRRLSQELLL